MPTVVRARAEFEGAKAAGLSNDPPRAEKVEERLAIYRAMRMPDLRMLVEASSTPGFASASGGGGGI